MAGFESGSSGVNFSYTSTLTGSIRPGVGIGDDLKVKIKKNLLGRWFPMLTKGWYYKSTEERYLFANKQTQAIVYGEASTIITSSITGTTTVPSSALLDYGPVFLNNTDESKSFVQVCGSLRAFCPATWTSIGETTLWSSPVPGLLVEARSTNYPELWPVPTSGCVKSDEYYYYNELLSTIYVASATNPSGTVFLTYVTSATGATLLQQDEIHIVEPSNIIKTMHANVAVEDPTRLPIVRAITTTGLFETTVASSSVGTGTSNNVITLSSPITSGDQVAVSYYVNESFVLDGGDLSVYATAPMTGQLDYEGSDLNYQDLSTLATSDLSYVQLNPIYSGVDAGFLFLAEEQNTQLQAYNLYLTRSPLRSQIISGTAAPVRILAQIVDKHNNPVPGVTLSSSAYGEGSLPTSSIFPPTQITDWNGTVTYSWKPSGAGISTFVVEVSATTSSALSALTTVTQVVTPITTYEGTQQPAKLYLYADTTNVPKNNIIPLHVMLASADGVPCVDSGVTVGVISERSSIAGSNNKFLPTLAFLLRNTGVATLKYKLIGKDTIRAYYYDSNRLTYVYSDKLVIGA